MCIPITQDSVGQEYENKKLADLVIKSFRKKDDTSSTLSNQKNTSSS